MRDHDRFRDRQAQSHSPCLTISRFFQAVERGQDFFEVSFRDAWPIIDDENATMSVRFLDRDFSVSTIVQGIVDNIAHSTPQPYSAAFQRTGPVWWDEGDRQRLILIILRQTVE